MQAALARSVAESAAAVLRERSNALGGVYVTDEAIGAHLWFERGFQDHDALVQLINCTREILDRRSPVVAASPVQPKPHQRRKARH